MKWPAWMLRLRPARNGGDAAAARADAQRKLDEHRRGQAEIRRQIDAFTAEVDRALRGEQ